MSTLEKNAWRPQKFCPLLTPKHSAFIEAELYSLTKDSDLWGGLLVFHSVGHTWTLLCSVFCGASSCPTVALATKQLYCFGLAPTQRTFIVLPERVEFCGHSSP